MKAHWLYFRYVIRHKWFVFWAGVSLGVPFWRLIIHDWSKFLPSEWFPYVDFFYTDKKSHDWLRLKMMGYSVPDQAPYGMLTEDKFNLAWNYHQKRNDHHWQYWVRINDDGQISAMPMSKNAMLEMLADWVGAGKALGGKPVWEWYEENKDKMILRSETRAKVEKKLAEMKNTDRSANMLGFNGLYS